MEKPNLSEEYLPAEHTPPIPFSKVTPGGDYRLGKVDVPNMYCVEGHQNNVKSVLTYYKFGVSVPYPKKPHILWVVKNIFSFYIFCYPYDCLGAALLHSTGSHAFLVFLKARARKQGLILRQSGIYQGQNKIHGKTEEGIFQAMCLPYVDPLNRNVSGHWSTWDIPELKWYKPYMRFIESPHEESLYQEEG